MTQLAGSSLDGLGGRGYLVAMKAKAIILTLLAALPGCAFPTFTEEGPLCTEAQTLSWEPAPYGPGDLAPKWANDPELEDYLLSYGMDSGGGWEGLIGNDLEVVEFFGEEIPLAKSPYARALSAYELIATSFDGWEDFDPDHNINDFTYHDNPLKWFAAFVHQRTAPVWATCAAMPSYASQTRRVRKNRITFFAGFFTLPSLQRASLIVHEVKHVGGPNHPDGRPWEDQKWGQNSYTYQVLWLVAYAHNQKNGNFRDLALASARSILNGKFVEPTTWTAEALEQALEANGTAYFINAVPTYEP